MTRPRRTRRWIRALSLFAVALGPGIGTPSSAMDEPQATAAPLCAAPEAAPGANSACTKQQAPRKASASPVAASLPRASNDGWGLAGCRVIAEARALEGGAVLLALVLLLVGTVRSSRREHT